MTAKVVSIDGGPPPGLLGEPNQEIIATLKEALVKAKLGQIQCLIMTGFASDGSRLTAFAGNCWENVSATLGAIAWLEHEYVERTTSDPAA